MQLCAACRQRQSGKTLREPYFYDPDFDPCDGLKPLPNLDRSVLACPHCGLCYLHRLVEGNMYSDYDEHVLEPLDLATSDLINGLARRPLDLPAVARASQPAGCDTQWLAAVPSNLLPVDLLVNIARERLARGERIAWACLGSRADLPPADRDFFLAAAAESLDQLRRQLADNPHLFGLFSPPLLQFLRHLVAAGHSIGPVVATVEALAPRSGPAFAVLIQRYLCHPDADAVQRRLAPETLAALTDLQADLSTEHLDRLWPAVFEDLKIELDRPAGVRPDSRHISLILGLLRAIARRSDSAARDLYQRMAAAGLDAYADRLPNLFHLEKT
ncbi:MAG TPA: hypothetical protein VL860_07350 [Planctomycetota bacterium]|nr:hypothetical protein [Planctomycetota bacterium]